MASAVDGGGIVSPEKQEQQRQEDDRTTFATVPTRERLDQDYVDSSDTTSSSVGNAGHHKNRRQSKDRNKHGGFSPKQKNSFEGSRLEKCLKTFLRFCKNEFNPKN